MLGTTTGEEVFNDVDYEDDVSLLAQMAELLLVALDTMGRGLEINWDKIKIQTYTDHFQWLRMICWK